LTRSAFPHPFSKAAPHPEKVVNVEVKPHAKIRISLKAKELGLQGQETEETPEKGCQIKRREPLEVFQVAKKGKSKRPRRRGFQS
jgi:hypothetical protein